MATVQLGAKAVGSTVKLRESGVLTEFYVAKHDYESELNGPGRTLLVRKDCYDQRKWRSSNVNAYANSTIDSWLNSTYKNLLDADIRAAMGTTKIYYTPGNGDTSKATLERSVFLSSATELGQTHQYLNAEGTALEIANTLKIAHLNGSAAFQCTRSPCTNSTTDAWQLGSDGSIVNRNCTDTAGSRPAFTLPATLSVRDDGYVFVPGTSTTLGSKAVGSIVSLKINGALRDFIVVQQGKPSSLYDDSCDGTWLLTKDIHEKNSWRSNGDSNDYANSNIHSYLNSTWLNLIDANIREQIKQVKIPYRPGSGASGTVNSGADGLSCKIFLLSAIEVGITYRNSNKSLPGEGERLTFFNNSSYGSDKIATYNGAATRWWLRTPQLSSEGNSAYYLNEDGYIESYTTGNSLGNRPAMILPANLVVSDDGTVRGNTAPTTPASITIPDSVQGGTSIQVSWSAASDAENNLEGYIVERSTDGGGTWVQVYQGTSTSTTNTVPAGSETVMYRVKAYDSEGLYSTYRNSAQVSVFNNAVPSAPGGITIPEEVLGGGSLTVTWTASTDPDNNLEGYELERQVDGGEWTQVYKGPNMSFTDTITRGWTSVNYRVRAYDAYNAASGYAMGTAREVDNNRAPAITCGTESGSDLGTKDAGFSITYSAGDEDGDAVTVTEEIDGAAQRTFTATPGETYTFQVTGETFMKVLNGDHALTITASDGQAAAVHKLTFTKSVTAASVTLSEPMEADGKITICVLAVAGDIPADAQYSVKVTNNANDTAPVWEDCTTEVKNGGNHVFENETAENGFAFNFKVEVERGASGIGGYISSVQGGFQ